MLRLLNMRLKSVWRRSEEGVAMVMVLGVGSVLTLLIVAAIATSLGGMTRAQSDEDWNAALAAAYAGVEEYQSQISDDPAYVQYGNPASAFSAVTPPTVTLPTGVLENPAFDLGDSGTWATVAGSDGEAQFRYEVDNSAYASTGTVRLRATGKVGDATRSLVADLRQRGFIDFLYFTDYELLDPSIFSGCQERYAWNRTNNNCEIQFGPDDIIGGPVHSNDRLIVCGARFLGVVTTGYPSGGYSTSACASGSGTPTFELGPPTYSPQVPMPATNTQLIKEMRTDIPTEVPKTGCLYTGPTKIELLPTQSGGKARMTVWSPWTKATNIADSLGTTGSAPAKCGTLAALRSSTGATIDVPENNVVFVQNIPLTGANGWSNAATIGSNWSSSWCKDYHASGNGGSRSTNVVGFPHSDEKVLVSGTGSGASYGCRNGDVFIKGTLNGTTVTVAAQNYVYVTGDIKYHDSDKDMLGLVGDNAVWVYNPVRYNNTPLLSANDRRIDAAILSLQHTFMVQNYNVGSSRGTLEVNGAIAQKFRGAVATTGNTGYGKNYVYDKRFRYTAPPKFLSPVTTTYGVSVWIEINPVFNADGTYR